MPKLSVVMPAINPDRWQKWYDTFTKSYSGDFELIILGPNPPQQGFDYSNIIFIKDDSMPSRRFQRGLLFSVGEYIMFSFDDAEFYPKMIDETFKLHDGGYKTVVSCKYLESDLEYSKKTMIKDDYYTLWFHKYYQHENVPKHFQLWQTGIAKREYIIELGGIDCQFEAMPLAVQIDLAVRMQFDGAKFIQQQGFVLRCDWNPNPNRAPAQATYMNDITLYQSMFWNKIAYENRIKIDLNNWKKAPDVWERRKQLNAQV